VICDECLVIGDERASSPDPSRITYHASRFYGFTIL
jgi:hypothetical protein